MTATRIAGLATLAAAWLFAAALLWQTDVPGDLEFAPVDAAAVADDLDRRERLGAVLRALGVGALLAQVAVLVLLARRPPRVRGPALLQAVQLALVVVGALALARLPFGLAAHWRLRVAGVRHQGYSGWLGDLLPGLASTALLVAVASLVAVGLARAVGPRWWIAGAPAVALLGAGAIVLQPVFTPRLERLRDSSVVARVERLAERQGLRAPRVELQETANRTRAVNALAIGIGPTTRVILWDTAVALPRRELDFLVAHELAHVSRSHLWKGAAWFALFALPGVFVVARLADLRDPRQLPRAALAAAVFALAVSPLGNAISRRYEAEADWVAVTTTRDPAGARASLERLAALALRDPDPPWLARQLFGTHPSLVERVALVRARH